MYFTRANSREANGQAKMHGVLTLFGCFDPLTKRSKWPFRTHGAPIWSPNGRFGLVNPPSARRISDAAKQRKKTSNRSAILCAELRYINKSQSATGSVLTQPAPKVWLQSQDPYLPSDIGSQLAHTKPEVNFNVVDGGPSPLTLDNLASLNAVGGKSVYLTSIDDVTKNPTWLKGVMPDGNGKTNGATSCAVIVNDHGSGNVDAYYMYFYAFDQGNTVFGLEIGDHVGDWEHNMIRFKNGLPEAIWYSQHSYGEAFTYSAVEKQGQRPVTYSAKGTHANYATTG
ncbi:MAG: hypothetical protein LQ338_005656 [Usnochroma carphineum]|nr:MAG: hypothetical protein LQ338_005656 [Usnochroma carphineum]